ncbi:DUF2357 domain-containing protein [Bacillus thuringiensis]|nr:DUF2357 domain-containing protein [Bacillus thuringiensis]
MDIPFEVVICQYNTKQVIRNFVTNEASLYKMNDEDIVNVTENLNLEVLFQSDISDSKLYMDGLDTLSLRDVEVDEDTGEVFLYPESSPVIIYENNKNSNGEYYPLIPGFYRIKVIVEQTTYYSWFKVNPKQITEEQWGVMRDEIEETMHGLAQDLVRKNASLGIHNENPLPINILRKLYIIKKDFSKWISSLRDIQEKPRSSIKKQYQLVAMGRAGEIDERTIKYRSRFPESRDQLYIPKHMIEYNLPENQWIIYIINFLLNEINELMRYLHEYINKVNQEIESQRKYSNDDHMQIRTKQNVLNELNEYRVFLKRLRNECSLIQETHWAQEIQGKKPRFLPRVIHLDLRYRKVYQLYRMLKNEKLSIVLDVNYDFYWKRTDLLYEIWGFLKVMRSLGSDRVGFKVKKGWIYDTSFINDTIKIPFLESGTTIEYQRDQIKLLLVYEEQLPFEDKNTSIEKPLFTRSNHNKPDTRIDVYMREEYIGGIIIDYKYRPQKYIWDSRKKNPFKQTDTMRQLSNYRTSIESSYIYGEKDPSRSYLYRPIHEVWAIFPRHEKNKPEENSLETDRIRLVQLSPQDEVDMLEEMLLQAIEKVIEAY